MSPVLRLATPADSPAIAALMQASAGELFGGYYDEREAASGARYFAVLDETLIQDGTYYVADEDGDLVACGGWSRRNKLFNGTGDGADARLLDPATEPARIRAMFVRADRTRRGLGRAILTACVDAARAEGFTELALMATLPGVPLYRAFGFTGDEHAAVTLPDGVVVSCLPMRRAVDAVDAVGNG